MQGCSWLSFRQGDRSMVKAWNKMERQNPKGTQQSDRGFWEFVGYKTPADLRLQGTKKDWREGSALELASGIWQLKSDAKDWKKKMEAAQCGKACGWSLQSTLQLSKDTESSLKCFNFLGCSTWNFRLSISCIQISSSWVKEMVTRKQESEIPSWTKNKHLCHRQMDCCSAVQNTRKDVWGKIN